MIVRKMGDGRLLCVHQTTHALMAAQFCRFWGNDSFAAPRPYAPVMMAIAQHDNGWAEWETAPKLRDDGFPMDFMTFTDQVAKTRLWQVGIDRAWGQHPYAALIIGRHASILYEQFQARDAYDPVDNAAVNRFLADQRQLLEQAHQLLGDDPGFVWALQPEVIEANARLLQFGDHASLQVSVPWAKDATLSDCPVDYSGTQTKIRMRYDDAHISFDPWPFAVDQFDVSLEGYLIDQDHFANENAYHQALAKAKFYRQTWQVARA